MSLVTKIVPLALLSPFLMAQPLPELLKSVTQSPLYRSQAAEIDAQVAQNRADWLQDAWRIGGDAAYAEVKDGSDEGGEYTLSLGKTFNLGTSKLDRAFGFDARYAAMRKEVAKNRLRTRIWRLYRHYCLTMRTIQAKGELGVIYDEMSRHIDKGVRFGEFDASKSIMAHLALENLNLQIAELDSRLQELQAQIEAIVPFDGEFQCAGLTPDIEAIFAPENSALWPLLHAKTDHAKAMVSVAANPTPGLDVDGSYTDELDTRRYTLSLSLPLSFGAKNEAQRLAAMKLYESARQELESLQRRYSADTRALHRRIVIYREHLKNSEHSIALSADTLIEQSRMRFKAGEESLLELLKAAETKLQMIETILSLKTQRLDAVADYMDRYAVDPLAITHATNERKRR
ncbi:TolC family protein [Hydrogenimonas sp.]